MTPLVIIKDEPREAAFVYRGFNCFIRRHPTSLHLCGYVAVPEGHKMFNCGCDELFSIDCHGGLTYAQYDLPGDTQLQGNFWWIGFDCAHSGDWTAGGLIFGNEVYRSFGYVFLQVTNIVEQLEKMQ